MTRQFSQTEFQGAATRLAQFPQVSAVAKGGVGFAVRLVVELIAAVAVAGDS
jgi:hypothetical protein